MIAAYYDRRFQFAFCHQVVQPLAEKRALPVTQPTDTCRQSLESYMFARQIDPAVQNLVFREKFQHEFIATVNIAGFPGERHPAKRSAPFAKEGSDVGWDKTRKRVCILHAVLECHGADVIPVVEGNGTQLLKLEHSSDMARD